MNSQNNYTNGRNPYNELYTLHGSTYTKQNCERQGVNCAVCALYLSKWLGEKLSWSCSVSKCVPVMSLAPLSRQWLIIWTHRMETSSWRRCLWNHFPPLKSCPFTHMPILMLQFTFWVNPQVGSTPSRARTFWLFLPFLGLWYLLDTLWIIPDRTTNLTQHWLKKHPFCWFPSTVLYIFIASLSWG